MFSSIILVPIGKNVNLISISLNLINLIKNYNFSVVFFKLIFEKSKSNCFDETTEFIFRKKISNFINPVFIDNVISLENKNNYNFFLEKTIKKYYSIKGSKKIILIEGINTKYNNYIERKFNIDFAKSTNSKIIFVNNYNKFFDIHSLNIMKNIFFKNFFYYKNIILGFILHKYEKKNIIKNYFHLQLYKCNKKKKNKIFFKKVLKKYNLKKTFRLLDIINWNFKIKKVYVSYICKILKIKYLYYKKTFNKKVKFFIFNDINVKKCKNFYKYHFLIIDTNNKKNLKNFLYILDKKYNVGSILLVINNINIRYFINIFFKSYKNNIPIFFTKKKLFYLYNELNAFSNNIFKIKHKIKNIIKTKFFLYNYNYLIKNIFIENKKIFFTPHYFKYYLKKKSKKLNNIIIFPEGYETRILKAVSFCSKEKIAKCILLGNKKKIIYISNYNNISLGKNIKIIDPTNIRNNYINLFIKSRLPKILDKNSAKELLKDNCVLATLMLKNNEANCLISGSVNTTANTIRPALQIIKTKSSSSIISSFFFMLIKDKVLIYADCAININPNAIQLAEIAIETSKSAINFGILPKVAMISYSTKCSGFGPSVDKVKEATEIVKKKYPKLLIDGPVQYDVASSKEISKLKNYISDISGEANIFIFPDLNSGNAIYKAVQNITNSISIGPILQGINKPVNDLSRGSTVEDIIYTSAVTSIQC
ncbi:phosphate acetyltransferase [Buchnera aphidicola (Pseudoregma panicola)]|uniref:phosphate acetyltransferase n=1 Tax=Buchnera aphidicola TaxID=9 RepID=UPI0031B6952F